MFGPLVDFKILEHAKSVTPHECCGFIVNGRFEPAFNFSRDPENYFNMRGLPDDVQAVVHSHPNGPFYPSKADMMQQITSALPWGIAAFDDEKEEVFWFGGCTHNVQLLGRGFRHGVTDCYSLIRDFYKSVLNLTLREFPREWEWWQNTGDLYDDGFTRAGFHEIPINSLKPGDVILMGIRSNVSNHAAIYLGDGMILHHTSGRIGFDPFHLSTIDNIERWQKFFTKALQHENDYLDRCFGNRVWQEL